MDTSQPGIAGILALVAPVLLELEENSNNGSPGVSITESGGSTTATEGGAVDSYTMVLTSQPTANVTIAVSADTQVRVNGGASVNLVFTSANWNTTQTVTVTAVDDLVTEGNHAGTISHSSSSTDANYNGITVSSVTVSITDNDSAGVSITESGGTSTATEGGAGDSYTVVLTSQPTANVTIAVSADAQTRVNGVASVNLVFTSADWNTTQTVTVTGVDDLVAEGNHAGTISHAVTSGDSNYNAIAVSSVTVSITDNDSAGVSIVQSGGTTTATEGGAGDSYTVVLTSQPTANVTVAVSADAQTRVNGLPSVNLVFTSANWNTTQTVTATAVDDFVAEGNHAGTISHASTSGDANYNGITVGSVTVSITDNDSAGVSIVQSGGSTTATEGGAGDSYTVVLTSLPTTNVTVAVSADAQTRVNGIASVNLIFTSANWNTTQTVTASAFDDAIAEGNHTGTISHSATSGDANYNGITVSSVTVSITDNDSAGVSITEAGGTTTATEGGAGDSYTVVLTSQPTANVTVAVSADAQVRVNGVASVNLVFSSANWNTTQTINVTAVDDALKENDHTGTISHTAVSGDSSYNAITIANVSVSITDNDIVSPTLSYAGSPYTFTHDEIITTITPTLGGDPPTSCSSSPALPAGLNISATTCAISGTPTVIQGATGYTITVSNYGGNSTANINIEVIPPTSITRNWGTFTDLNNGTVSLAINAGTYGGITYAAETIIWMKCSQGQAWNSVTNQCTTNGTSPLYGAVVRQYCQDLNCLDNGHDPVTYLLNGIGISPAYSSCNNLNAGAGTFGLTNWRVPARKELKLLIQCNDKAFMPRTFFPRTDCGGAPSPAINSLFPNTPASNYWSANTIEPPSGYAAWYVNFSVGETNTAGSANSMYIRCVSGP